MQAEAELDLEFPPSTHTHKESITAALDAIKANPGRVLICGSREAGKSSFAHNLLRKSLEHDPHITACLIDLDPALSHLAPPAVTGAAEVTLKPGDGPELAPLVFGARTLHFIGDCQPAGYALEMLAALGRLAATKSGSGLMAIDMPTLAPVRSSFRLIGSCIELVRPRHVVILSRAGEWDMLAATLQHRQDVRAHLLEPATDIPPRPQEFRARRQALRFGSAFESSSEIAIEMARCTLRNTWLGMGKKLAPHLFKYLTDSLSDFFKVFYAQQNGPHLGILVNHRSREAEQALSIAMEQLGARFVTVSTVPELKHRLVGLHSDNGKFLGLGRVERIDFARETIHISTPVKAAAAISMVTFGGRCIADSGETVYRVPPEEL
jgi:polynucleotide 5'-kinase involved in rRNA processing